MIEVRELTKRYGGLTAVDHISFRIGGSMIYGLLGQNGAGKSSTMNMIAGCIAPTEGSVLVNGFDISENPVAAKRCIGYLPEIPPLYDDMTPEEYLTFIAEAKRVPVALIGGQVRDILRKTELTGVKDRLCRNLSKGYRQRVGIAGALVGDPDTIILDEPTVGLDPKQIAEIRNLIRTLGKTHTVIFSSHILSEISEVCDRVLILSHGKLVADEAMANLSGKTGPGAGFRVTVRGDEAGISSVLSTLPMLSSYTVLTRKDGTVTYLLETKENEDPRDEVFFALAAKRYAVLTSEPYRASLEEVFLRLTDDRQGGGRA